MSHQREADLPPPDSTTEERTPLDIYKSAFEHAPTGMAVLATDGRWLEANRALCELLGYSPQELLASTSQAITHPGDLSTELTYGRRLLGGELDSFQMEKRYLHKLGKLVWALLSVSLVRDTDGSPMYFIAQVQDITERKQAEELRPPLEEPLRQLPKMEAVGSVQTLEAGRPLAGPARGAETLLVVEDEEAVRELAHEILQQNGYTVLEARHGVEALLVCDRYNGPIHLMLTDVVMPQMSGRVLAERLVGVRPEMKVLYMSGYTHNALVHHGMLDPKSAFLQKPFTPDGMVRKVRELLDTPREG